MLVDLRNKGITGKAAEQALDRAGITVNKNTVPKETHLGRGDSHPTAAKGLCV